MSRLENWSIVNSGNPFTAPELIRKLVNAEVYDHPTRPNGDHITTSYIKEYNINDGWVQTKNTRYTLGAIDPSYSEWLEQNGYYITTDGQIEKRKS
jgi:hypothetical protein